MQTYIALLRGINVGGNNKIAMKDLKDLLEKNGFENVQTYIQSGNIVFQHASNDFDISKLIQQQFGFKAKVMILQPLQFEQVILNCPFKAEKGNLLHFYFCEETPNANLTELNNIKSSREEFEIIDNVFYLHAPDGIGRSKLATKAEKLLGVNCTARNFNTVLKIKEMLN